MMKLTIMKLDVVMNCPFCGNIHTVTVDADAFEKWQNGDLIQNVMPKLSATKREQLVSGICPKCQIDIFC